MESGNPAVLSLARMAVRVERNGPVTTVILDRPEVRNAVDGPTAEALADAFRAFDADDEARVARAVGRRRHVLRRRGPEGDRRAATATASRPTATARWGPRGCCFASR